MNKKILWIVSLTCSLVLGQTAFAAATEQQTTTTQQVNSTDQTVKTCGCIGEHMDKMMETLNLSADQQAKLKAIKEQTKEAVKANWEQMKALRGQFNQLVQSSQMDESKLNDLINQKKELSANMMKTKIMAKHQIYNLLNDQQKAQYQKMMQEWQEAKANKSCH